MNSKNSTDGVQAKGGQALIEVDSGELLERLPRLYESGVTEFFVHDRRLASDRTALSPWQTSWRTSARTSSCPCPSKSAS